MRIAPSLLAALAATLIVPAAALAAPPLNDNYLGSTRVPLDRSELSLTVDTTEATTQPDVFQPNADGQPLGGGPAEQTTCNGVAFGKTVWYDLAPATNYGLQLRSNAAFGVAMAVYEWNPQTSLITRQVACTTKPGEDLIPTLEAGKSYTVQVGGVANAGGPIGLNWTFFPDSDNDGAYDPIDDCPTVPGIGNSGCPPKLNVTPRVLFANSGGGIVLTKLFVERVPKGAKVVATCGGCGSQTVTAKKTGTVTLTKLTGKAVAAGKQIAVKVTLKAQGGKGKYRNGATGLYRRWTAKVGGLKSQPDRCVNAKTAKLEKCS